MKDREVLSETCLVQDLTKLVKDYSNLLPQFRSTIATLDYTCLRKEDFDLFLEIKNEFNTLMRLIRNLVDVIRPSLSDLMDERCTMEQIHSIVKKLLLNIKKFGMESIDDSISLLHRQMVTLEGRVNYLLKKEMASLENSDVMKSFRDSIATTVEAMATVQCVAQVTVLTVVTCLGTFLIHRWTTGMQDEDERMFKTILVETLESVKQQLDRGTEFLGKLENGVRIIKSAILWLENKLTSDTPVTPADIRCEAHLLKDALNELESVINGNGYIR